MIGRKNMRVAARSITRAQKLGVDMMMLGFESASVIGLRTVKLMQGDAAAKQEADQMIAEKVAAIAQLPWVLATGPRSPELAAKAVVSHFANKVRANRQRLAAGSKKAQ
jgi:hypothetical protein